MDLDRLEELAKNAPDSPYDETGRWHPDRERRLEDLQRAIEPEDVRALIEVARAARDVRDSGWQSKRAMEALSEALAAIDKST
jgi:hypothetical protein